MKRLLALLVVLAAGVVAAALAIPTTAAVVNGTSISQQTLNGDVSAIADSASYQCYLNSEEYVSSGGSSQLSPVTGAGKGQNPGDNPTATSSFVASYLDTEIGHQLVTEEAASRGITVTAAELTSARASLTNQVTNVMKETASTGQPSLTCGASGGSLSGQDVLGTLPASFVDRQVQFVATASALEEDLSGIGSTPADLEQYYSRHRAEFETVCLNAAAYTSETSAQQAAAAVASGTPFSQVAASASRSGSLGCGVLSDIAAELGTTAGVLERLAIGTVSEPLETGGGYFLVTPTSRTATPYATAAASVAAAVQRAGSTATQKALTAKERGAEVSVNPQYGIWVSGTANVFTPLTPQPSDVLNASANETAAPATSAGSSSSASG